jgi:Flp pilus assembly protein TadG
MAASSSRQLIDSTLQTENTMNAILRHVRKTRGSAAIEFALVMPLLFMLLSAVIDWGQYMSVRVSIARATMDGVRAGAAARDDASTGINEISQAANDRTLAVLAGMGKPCGGGCTVSALACNTGQAAPADCQSPPIPTVVVTVNYPYRPFFGFVPTPPNFREQFMMAQQSGGAAAPN